jgi:hypothetical protein
MTSMYIDGDIFVTDSGKLLRFVSGRTDGWEARPPADTLLRKDPVYSIVTGGTERRVGRLYAYDRPNQRIVAIEKVDGAYAAQYRLAGGVAGWDDLRGMYVIPGVDEIPASVVWISAGAVHQALLEAVPDVAPPSPTPTPTDDPDESEDPATATPKPTKKP